MKLILEFDDLHPNKEVDCLPVIEKLVKIIPDIKLNFFVPINYKNMPAHTNQQWCDLLRKHVLNGNVILAVHGLNHSTEEFKNKSYPESISALAEASAYFDCADLPFEKAFRGPHWGIGVESIKALIGLGYTHLYSHVSYNHITDNFKDEIKVVNYNWNLKDDYGVFENAPNDIIVAHGHTSPHQHLSCGNSIYDVYTKIVEIYNKFQPEFLKVTDI